MNLLTDKLSKNPRSSGGINDHLDSLELGEFLLVVDKVPGDGEIEHHEGEYVDVEVVDYQAPDFVRVLQLADQRRPDVAQHQHRVHHVLPGRIFLGCQDVHAREQQQQERRYHTLQYFIKLY